MSTEEPVLPSLLSREASGGDTADGGFSFQEAVLLAKVPRWLADDSFSMIIRESICDGEASFFIPGHGLRREGVEAKRERITPTKFWAEMESFRKIRSGSAGAFGGFTLACSELAEELKPVVNGLRRLRNPYPFYDPGSGVLEASYLDFEQLVVDHGHDAGMARFLFESVLVEPTWASALTDGQALFQQAMNQYLPWSLNCTGQVLSSMHDRLKKLIQSRKAIPIGRAEIDACLDTPAMARPAPLLRIHSTSSPNEKVRSGVISFSWERFFTDDVKSFEPADTWDRELIGALLDLRSWVRDYSRPRRIRLSGDRRLPTALAVGSVLSAVSGFTLEVDYRETVWSTDAHADASTPQYTLEETLTPGTGSGLTVVLGILRDISASVARYCSTANLSAQPMLHLQGRHPIVSAGQANLISRQVKDRISEALGKTGTRQIDFFIAGPMPLAVFLGHRLNAMAPIRCYGRTTTDEYRPACLIHDGEDR